MACSTKKNNLINRTYHTKTSRYNILYNGDVSLQTGLKDLNTNFKDNFWEILPVENMPKLEEEMMPDDVKNPSFERAEEKAVKAIQKHSMNIAGYEKNAQMDEAHVLLGKSRYFENRYIPALEAFNYVLYRYPNSNKVYEARVWREKINIRLGNEQLAIKSLKKIVFDKKIKSQDLANASAILTQAYLNLGIKDSALMNIKIAKEKTKINEQKARYGFILGQLYEELKKPDSAAIAFQEIIDMRRRASKKYTIQAHARLAQQFDFENGDTLVFLKRFNKLLEDRENRPFLDVLHHQMALFYDKQKKHDLAVSHYNKSLKMRKNDEYLVASNYRNIAEINFHKAKYEIAGKYYDSTLTKLSDKTREYRAITKKRTNLDDVIKYEKISKTNDSILYVAGLSDVEKNNYYSVFIEKLKAKDILKKKEEERLAQIALEKQSSKSNDNDNTTNASGGRTKSQIEPPSAGGKNPQSSNFYFYSPTNIAFGNKEFKKKWGSRELKDNWRLKSFQSNNKLANAEKQNENNSKVEATDKEKKAENPAYKVDFYISKLPKNKKTIDSLKVERDFADFQLGSIYKEKFKEYELAAAKLEKLLANQPAERLILPSKYILLKIYEIIGSPKGNAIKSQIINEYPESRHAQILQNPNQENKDNQSPEAVYNALYREFENGDTKAAYEKVLKCIDDYAGDEILPKFELLKAKILARLKGLEEYKKTLSFVALNYPNTEEGKKADALLAKDVPALEKLTFNKETKGTWKIVFFKNTNATVEIDTLQKKLEVFFSKNNGQIKWSNDLYNDTTNFIVVHGFRSKQATESTLHFLRNDEDYLICDEANIISSENYLVIQALKKWEAYLEQNK